MHVRIAVKPTFEISKNNLIIKAHLFLSPQGNSPRPPQKKRGGRTNNDQRNDCYKKNHVRTSENGLTKSYTHTKCNSAHSRQKWMYESNSIPPRKLACDREKRCKDAYAFLRIFAQTCVLRYYIHPPNLFLIAKPVTRTWNLHGFLYFILINSVVYSLPWTSPTFSVYTGWPGYHARRF